MTPEDRKLMQELRDAAVAARQAHESLMEQCFSNPITNAWGKQVDCTHFNEAGRLASNKLIAAADSHLAQPEPPVQSHEEWVKEGGRLATIAADAGYQCGKDMSTETSAAMMSAMSDLLAHLRNHPAAVPSKKVTLNGHQLAAALDFLNPDGEEDTEQRDSELVISWCPACGKGEEFMAEGYRAWYDEYPEEGCIELIAATKAGKDDV